MQTWSGREEEGRSPSSSSQPAEGRPKTRHAAQAPASRGAAGEQSTAACTRQDVMPYCPAPSPHFSLSGSFSASRSSAFSASTMEMSPHLRVAGQPNNRSNHSTCNKKRTLTKLERVKTPKRELARSWEQQHVAVLAAAGHPPGFEALGNHTPGEQRLILQACTKQRGQSRSVAHSVLTCAMLEAALQRRSCGFATTIPAGGRAVNPPHAEGKATHPGSQAAHAHRW